MIIYIIIAFSFSIMYHIRYVHHYLTVFQSLTEEYEFDDPIIDFNPIMYSLSQLIINSIFMPVLLVYMLRKDRWQIIKENATFLIKKCYVT